MTWDQFRLALGEWMTSSGFAGASALVAAIIAYFGLRHRANVDKDLQQQKVDAEKAATDEKDARERWWAALAWVELKAADVHPRALLNLLTALKGQVHTVEQSAMLEAVSDVVLKSKNRRRP